VDSAGVQGPTRFQRNQKCQRLVVFSRVLFFKGIDPQQLEEVKQVFHDLDTDGDGHITQNELHTMMTKLGLEPSPDDFDNLFHSLDLNGDGKIELEEFLSALKWLRKGFIISSKLEQPAKKGSGSLTDDKRTIQTLQEKNTILMNYLKDIINRGMNIAEENYKNKEYAVTKGVLDTLDWDTLEGMELFIGNLSTEKQKDHQKKMSRRLKNI